MHRISNRSVCDKSIIVRKEVMGDNELLLNQLNLANQRFVSVDSIYWTVFSGFWTTNAVLLVALTAKSSESGPSSGLLICSVGTVCCYVWRRLQLRVLGHERFFETIIDSIEWSLEVPKSSSVSRKRSSHTHIVEEQKTQPIRSFVLGLCRCASVAWASGTFYFLWRLTQEPDVLARVWCA